MSDFVTVADRDHVTEGEGLNVTVGDREIALFQIDGEFYAIGNRCPHAGGALADGQIEGRTVICPLHRARFSCETGDFLAPPAAEPVSSYEVRVEGNDIQIKRDW